MNTPIKCADCRHSYDGADGVLRCRPIHADANECTERRAAACQRFEREPGADGIEASRIWYCDGRGD